MEEVQIDIEMGGEDPFITEVYDTIKSRHHRGEDGVYTSDFLYDMFWCADENDNIVWWMSMDHPIARMLSHNLYEPEHSSRGRLGEIIVYTDEAVKSCRDCLVAHCERQGKKIIKNGTV